MGLVAFFKSLFETSAEELEHVKEKEKQRVLRVMANCYQSNRNAAISLSSIYYKLKECGWYMEVIPLIDIITELTRMGFIQRLDGGDSEKPAKDVEYVISDRGLNFLGFSGR